MLTELPGQYGIQTLRSVSSVGFQENAGTGGTGTRTSVSPPTPTQKKKIYKKKTVFGSNFPGIDVILSEQPWYNY